MRTRPRPGVSLPAAALATALTASAIGAQEAPPFASFDLASAPFLNDPHDLAMGPDGRIYVADKFGNRIVVLDPETLEELEVIGPGLFPGVHDISFGPDGSVAVAVTAASAVFLYDSIAAMNERPKRIIAAPRSEGALIHSNGRIYAMASGTGSVAVFEADQAIAGAEGHFGAHDIAQAPDGSVWIADNNARRLVRYSPDMTHLQTLDHPKFGFVGPRYLDVTEFGFLVVADQDAHRILLINPDGPDGGTLIGVLGDGTPGLGPNLFDDPEGVLVDGTRFYISDSDNNRVVRYSIVMN